MKLTLFLFFILVFLTPHLCVSTGAEEDYLWLSFREVISGKNGNLIQPIALFFGRIPESRKDIKELDSLKVFCSLGERDDMGKEIFYKIDTVTFKGNPSVILASNESRWYRLIAVGEKTADNHKYFYIGETAFCFFGSEALKNSRRFTELKNPPEKIRIDIYYRRTKEYIRDQKIDNSPVQGFVNIDDMPYRNALLRVITEAGKVNDLYTDKEGSFVFKQGNDNRIFLSGKVPPAQNVILLKHNSKDVDYIITRTVPGGNILLPLQGKNTRHNIKLGLIIFFSSIAFIVTCAFVRRRKFRYESL